MTLTSAMAETVNSDPSRPPPKRRRILNLSAVVPVPIYSNQVSSSLQLKPSTFSKETTDDPAADHSLFSPGPPLTFTSHSDSEEEEEKSDKESEPTCCPSPPPPVSPVQQQSQCVRRKISEVDRKLRAVSSLLSPELQPRRTRRHCGGGDDDVIASSRHDEEDDDDDVTIVTPPGAAEASSPYSREFPLKVRCRTDVHKISVLSSTPLADVVTQMSSILDVPRPRLLMMREEAELPTDATVRELGLCIADIIECVVMAAEGGAVGGAEGSITVKLQSNGRDSSHHFTVNRDAPLGPVFAQYLTRVSQGSRGSRRAPTFMFDGVQLNPQQTPAQLDMEDDDIIQVWF
ncbi:NFATC2-interacting protein [Nelusetta ayraudi]|uniref:NFATC2-interacting protein n=1 Tax=Nelusetta ayraudi TaxID=303726 RepID=UPI003F715042